MESLKPGLKPLLKSENKIFVWAITIFSFILPFFFLTITTDFYFFNKKALLFLFSAIFLLVWAIKIFFEQEIKILKSSLNLPILGLMLAYLISSLIQAPNHKAALLNPTGTIICLGLLYFFIINHFRGKKPAIKVMTALISASVVLSWLTVFAYVGLMEKIGPQWLNKLWTPTGSPLITGLWMTILLPGTFYWAFKNKDSLQKVLLFMAGGLQILALILIASLFITKTISLTYLSPIFGWQISVEGLKNLKTALLGVGPNNFLAAFNQFRPAGLNNTSLWTAKFTTNSNQFFHLLSTVGLLGLICYLWIIWKSLDKDNFKGALINKVIYICLTLSFITQLIFTANLLVLFLTFIMVAMLQAGRMPVEVDMGYEARLKSQALVWTIAGASLILVLFSAYWQGRVWLAEIHFRKSLLAAQQNKGLETYNAQIKALTLNNFNENYRLSYANTNFALANSLSAQEKVSSQDREHIKQLISQAVREYKVAINLNPQISESWLQLARLYRNLINVADEADQWAMAAYLEAVKRDPTNPLLRVDFGGLFFSLEAYDQAINQFTQAVNLKPDYANAYYNLAAAYRAKEDWANAFQNMQRAMNLIPVDSTDYQTASEELEAIKANLPAVPEATGAAQLKAEEQLKKPEPLPSPNKKVGEVELPEEAAPELDELEGEEATSTAEP